jgi:hypothetical protein
MSAPLIIPESTALAARSQVERMTGIEPALSAWESARSACKQFLICGFAVP